MQLLPKICTCLTFDEYHFFNTWCWWLKEMKESFIQVLHLSPNIMNTLHIPLFLFLGGNNHSQVPSDKEYKLNTHFCSSVDQTYVGIGFIYLHCQVQLNKVSQRSVCGSCVLSQEWKRGTEDDTDCIHSPNAYIEGWRWEYGNICAAHEVMLPLMFIGRTKSPVGALCCGTLRNHSELLPPNITPTPSNSVTCKCKPSTTGNPHNGVASVNSP